MEAKTNTAVELSIELLVAAMMVGVGTLNTMKGSDRCLTTSAIWAGGGFILLFLFKKLPFVKMRQAVSLLLFLIMFCAYMALMNPTLSGGDNIDKWITQGNVVIGGISLAIGIVVLYAWTRNRSESYWAMSGTVDASSTPQYRSAGSMQARRLGPDRQQPPQTSGYRSRNDMGNRQIYQYNQSPQWASGGYRALPASDMSPGDGYGQLILGTNNYQRGALGGTRSGGQSVADVPMEIDRSSLLPLSGTEDTQLMRQAAVGSIPAADQRWTI